MRLLLLLFTSFLLLTSLQAQTDPGAAQDAEAERQKILKAADQIDLLQSNSETIRTEVDGFKQQLTQLQQQNTALQQQNTDLQQQLSALKDAFTKAEAARIKERQILLDDVARIVASGAKSKKKSTATPAPSESSPVPAVTNAPGNAAPVSPDNSDSPPEARATQKGYYHIISSGETLTMVAAAYRAQGVKVTVEDIQKANNLSDTSILQVGQKLFIPKPGT